MAGLLGGMMQSHAADATAGNHDACRTITTTTGIESDAAAAALRAAAPRPAGVRPRAGAARREFRGRI
jgi:hypothetical protein